MAGYSETPLARKLGIKENSQIALVGAPNNFHEELGTLPSGAAIVPQNRKPLDLIVLFVTRKADLLKHFTVLAQRLPATGMLWVAWPKKASRVPTDLNFDVVQKHGLSEGLVDIKICAVNDVWSGLKFVYRLKDRAGRS